MRAAVVFGQAGDGGGRDRFFDQFRISTVAFGKPVLYLMGDEHEWDLDNPWLEPNMVRLVVSQYGYVRDHDLLCCGHCLVFELCFLFH